MRQRSQITIILLKLNYNHVQPWVRGEEARGLTHSDLHSFVNQHQVPYIVIIINILKEGGTYVCC